MSDNSICVVCRETSDKMQTCYLTYETGGSLTMFICLKCYELTKENWLTDNEWKIMPETSEPFQDVSKPHSLES